MSIESKPPMTAGEVAEELSKFIALSKERCQVTEEVEHVRELAVEN